MADITGNIDAQQHITTLEEAYILMLEHNVNTYKQTNHQGKILAAYKMIDDNHVADITEQEQTRQEIEEQQKILRHLQALDRAKKAKEKT